MRIATAAVALEGSGKDRADSANQLRMFPSEALWTFATLWIWGRNARQSPEDVAQPGEPTQIPGPRNGPEGRRWSHPSSLAEERDEELGYGGQPSKGNPPPDHIPRFRIG